MLERRVSLSRETNPRRDKNGVKPRENKIKDASSPASLVVDVGSISSLVKNARWHNGRTNDIFSVVRCGKITDFK